MALKIEDPKLELKFVGFFDKTLGIRLIAVLQSEGWGYVGSSGKDNETTLRFIKVT